MVTGQNGRTGATALSLVAAECRIDQELVPILRQLLVESRVLERVTKHELATKILAQVIAIIILCGFLGKIHQLSPFSSNGVLPVIFFSVDGNWSDWKDWGECPVSCGGGVQNRSRTCTNPPPAFGGESCPGESDETRACNEDPCPSKMFTFIIFCTV